jgi:hypothetical protein
MDHLHYRVSDPNNGEYSRDLYSFQSFNGGIAIFSKINIPNALNAGSNINVRMGDSGNKVMAVIMNFDGIGAATLDQVKFNPAHAAVSPSANVFTTGTSPATTQANELVIAGILLHIDSAYPLSNVTEPAGYTRANTGVVATAGGSAGTNGWVMASWRELTATGTQIYAPSAVSVRNYRSALATYKIVSTQTGTNYTSTLTDSFAIAENLARLGGKRSVDSFGLNENLARISTRLRTYLDSMTLSETLARQLNNFRSFADGLTLSETLARTFTNLRNFADSLALSETFSRQGGKRSLDTATAADTVSRQPRKSAADNLSLTETLSRSNSYFRVSNDALNVSDIISFIKSSVRSFSEVLGLFEGFSKSLSKPQADNMAVTDTISQSAVRTSSFFDTLAASETIAIIRTNVRTFVDSLGIG